jgi:plasmid maintenance system antidote protein VapI
VVRSHREYTRWRARQIAYGRWEPWADAAAARSHVRRLRTTGVSYEALAVAAGVSPMTVHRLLHGKRRPGDRGRMGRQRLAQVSAEAAQRLLAVTPAMVEQVAARRDATGTRRRLQALIAVGHLPAALARWLGVAPRAMARIVRGSTATVNPALHAAVCDLYERLWDVAPPGQTLTERRAAAAARALAAGHGWPAPMGLDDSRIDEPAYRPRAHWRPAAGSGDARRHRHGPWSTGAALPERLSTVVSGREPSRGSGCQAVSAQHRQGGRS